MFSKNKILVLVISALAFPFIPLPFDNKIRLVDVCTQLAPELVITVEGEILPPPCYLRDDLECFPPDNDCRDK